MRALSVLLLAAAGVSCGSVTERGDCAVSTDCAPGAYCAPTADGNVCWPDAVPPTVSGVTVSCDSTPCLRSGVLRVEATISDDAEVLGARVTLDSGGGVAMSRAAGRWVADVPLRAFPFDYVEHAVTVTVTATDGARNETALDAETATTVTRVRFSKPLDAGVFGLTPPAVMGDGTVVAAGTNAKVYFVPWEGTGVASVAVGAGQITAAPLVAGASVWIGSEDGRVYEVLAVGGGVFAASSPCNTTRPIRGSLAATSSGVVIATSETGRVYAVTESGCGNSGPGDPLALGPVIDGFGSVYAVAGTAVRRLTLDANGIPDDDPAFVVTTLEWPVAEPLAATTDLIAISSLGTQGRLVRVMPEAAVPQYLATTGAGSGGVSVLSDGSILVPERTETISRWPSIGAVQPDWRSPVLGGFVRTPLVLDDGFTPFIVSTTGGDVHALRPDGAIAWSVRFRSAALQPGNLYTPPGQPPGHVLSTAYFAGADGWLHALIVDGALDLSAPWPKAFHDPQNTNRAGALP